MSTYYCPTCDYLANCERSYAKHLGTNKHKKRSAGIKSFEDQQKYTRKLAKEKHAKAKADKTYYCAPCKYAAPTECALDLHSVRKYHKRNVAAEKTKSFNRN